MPDDNALIPSEYGGLSVSESIAIAQMPLSLQIFFNDALFKRCQTVANYLAKAEGSCPKHLLNKPEACFAVVSRALTWRLDPYAVAQATYQTPGGQVGYSGSLCQAILENSGQLEAGSGGVYFEHFGDWSRVRGKFRIATSDRGTKYPVPAWEPIDEAGLGVIVRAQLKHEAAPRELTFDLVQAYPRNSTLWATDPHTQICYTAVRRFATSRVPTLFMGVPFDREDYGDWADTLQDVTPQPRPELREYTDPPARPRGRPRKAAAASSELSGAQGEAHAETEERGEAAPPPDDEKLYAFATADGELHEFADFTEAVAVYAEALEAAANVGPQALAAAWENGAGLLDTLRANNHAAAAEQLERLYDQLAGDRSDEPDAAADAPSKDDPLKIPLVGSVQSWFAPARARLREMTEAHAPPADFRRFRELHESELATLKRQFKSWYPTIDKLLVDGERGEG